MVSEKLKSISKLYSEIKKEFERFKKISPQGNFVLIFNRPNENNLFSLIYADEVSFRKMVIEIGKSKSIKKILKAGKKHG